MSVANPSPLQRLVNWGYHTINNLSVSQRTQRPGDIVDHRGITRAVGFSGSSQAGVKVNHETAKTLAALFAGMRTISEDVAKVDVQTFRRTDQGKKQVDLPLTYLLDQSPNEEMPAQAFIESLAGHCVTWGNGYAEIQRYEGGRFDGQPYALWPLLPDRTKPWRLEDGTLIYLTWSEQQGRWIPLPAADVLHVRGMGFNGLVGYDVVSCMAQTIGIGLATNQYSASFFGNGTHISGGLFHPEKLGQEGADRLRKEFEQIYRGAGNAFKMAVFEEGLDWKPFSTTPEAAKLIEVQKFTVREVARWLRVKPHKIGDLEDATYSNIEQESIEHVSDTIQPWIVRFEQEMNRKLITPAQRRKGLRVKFNMDSLLRGEYKTRWEGHKIGREIGALSANDILEREDLNTIGPEGDARIVPLNFQNMERLVKPVTVDEDAPPNRLQIQNAIGPLATEAVERIQIREIHRVNDAMKAAKDRADFGRRLTALLDQQRDYAATQLNPIAASAFYILFPHDATVPALVTRVVDAVVAAYTARHDGHWFDDYDAEKNAELSKAMVSAMVDDFFERVQLEGASHENRNS